MNAITQNVIPIEKRVYDYDADNYNLFFPSEINEYFYKAHAFQSLVFAFSLSKKKKNLKLVTPTQSCN